MPQFTVNPQRFDPYKKFKFRIKWDGMYIPGVCKVSELKRTTKIISFREGGDPNTVHFSPGLTTYEPIVLMRGRTHDNEFEQWVNKVWNFGSGLGAEISLKDFRKDIAIELFNEAGQLAMRFHAFRCWPSEYSPLSPLNSDDNSTLYESIILQHEGWERDYDVEEPAEGSFTEPS